MKITRRALRRIIKEEKAKLLEYEQYVDEEGNVYDDEGNVTKKGRDFGRRFGGETFKGTLPPWTGSSMSPDHGSSRGATNQTKIAAIELAISERPDNFLKSILSQLNTGRRLSAKQNTIIRKILSKPVYSADAALFEQSARKMRITKRQLRKIIREETATIDYDTADEVETKEDVWSGGDNLSLSLDHSKVVGSEAVTAEPEILSLTERQLRDAIRDATKRAR
jgi:hypothetical protein|tara:strand:+ start:385 stop:1053 length:669 start_codon:yes stop_codon:yes gene_type:complete